MRPQTRLGCGSWKPFPAHISLDALSYVLEGGRDAVQGGPCLAPTRYVARLR
jgi:hypothetical protein